MTFAKIEIHAPLHTAAAEAAIVASLCVRRLLLLCPCDDRSHSAPLKNHLYANTVHWGGRKAGGRLQIQADEYVYAGPGRADIAYIGHDSCACACRAQVIYVC